MYMYMYMCTCTCKHRTVNAKSVWAAKMPLQMSTRLSHTNVTPSLKCSGLPFHQVPNARMAAVEHSIWAIAGMFFVAIMDEQPEGDLLRSIYFDFGSYGKIAGRRGRIMGSLGQCPLSLQREPNRVDSAPSVCCRGEKLRAR